VLDALEKTGADVVSPEKDNYRQLLTKSKVRKLNDDNHIHYEAIKKGILVSDAVVIEISHQDFQIGYEAALAIANKKPVLCLSIYEDFSEKINNSLFFGAKYSEVTIDNIVDEFLSSAVRGVYKERFNFFLSPTQLVYLKKSATKSGINKSEYLRSLIDKERFNGS
jgi:nucleoside 2-deoxyribosyltransferase